jgi:hypothetical protein
LFYTDATNSRVGVGTISPAQKLDVVGSIKSSDNIIQGTAAKGFNFTANTPAAGMTTQLLNDYEEGIFTPTMGFVTDGDLAITYTAQAGWYIKVGSLVTAHFRLSASSFTHTTASGAFQIRGLPFTCSSTTSLFGTGAVVCAHINMTSLVAATYAVARIGTGTTIVNIQLCGAPPGSGAVNATTASVVTASTPQFSGLVTYRI